MILAWTKILLLALLGTQGLVDALPAIAGHRSLRQTITSMRTIDPADRELLPLKKSALEKSVEPYFRHFQKNSAAREAELAPYLPGGSKYSREEQEDFISDKTEEVKEAKYALWALRHPVKGP